MTTDARVRVRRAVEAAGEGLVDRQALLELVALAAIAREHVLVVGPPGTAKSEAVRRIARAFGGKTFEYLLGRFTEPSEIFGPVDLRKLKEGVVETETRGMLPEADLAFLDEIFLGSTAILNTLLGVLNERRFRRGHTSIACPLRVCVAATNEIPEEAHLAAFADRFLVRVFVEPMSDPRLEELLAGGWALSGPAEAADAARASSLDDLDALTRAARAMDLTEVTPHLAEAVRLLRRAGISLSDRRIVKAQSLVAAAAALAGRDAPTRADLWPLITVVPTHEAQSVARQALRPMLDHAENPALERAAAEVSLGALARARELVTAGTALLAERPGAEDEAATERWRLRAEGVLRTIDAGFHPSKLPEDLSQTRAELARLVAPT